MTLDRIIKAYLLDKSDSPEVEVRRFVFSYLGGVPKFTEFKAKLEQLFPSLSGTNFSVTWNDEDGDSVTMSSDEELALPLSIYLDRVFKVYLHPSSQKPSQGKATPKKSNEKAPPVIPKQSSPAEPNEELHPNVVCDGCNANITGSRFKCLECSNFDLCRECFVKDIHPNHDMIKIVSSIAFMHHGHFFEAMRHMWYKQAKKAAHHQDKAQAKQAKVNARLGYSHRHLGHKWQRLSKDAAGDSNGWRYEPQYPNLNQEALMTDIDCPEPIDAGHGAVDFLKCVGEEVFNLLDPLGIDVLIDVETKGTKPEEKEPEVKEPAASASSVGPTETNDKKENPEETNTKPKHEESPENGWTLINNSNILVPEQNSNPEAIAACAPPLEENNEKQGPNVTLFTVTKPERPLVESGIDFSRAVPLTSAFQIGASSTLYPNLEDPKLMKALSQMISMGYSNEGGWLSALLKAKNGDIAEVLDVLHPQLPSQ